jgi:hypothetical protein
MRLDLGLQFSACLVALSVIGGSVASSAQSLAEVAKKEEERRKTVKAAGKVYTNKDLGSLPPGSVTPPPAATPAPPTADAAAKETEKPEDKEPPKDQAYWAGRMNELRLQLQRDQTYVDALQSRVNVLSADFVNRDDPAQRQVLSSERQKAVAELERLKQQIQATTKAVADLEEEARRAGVPPGWLR